MDPKQLNEVFFPIACKAASLAKQKGNRFAYYTTAEVAYQIIQKKRIWMRSTTTMNDYMEIQYGRDLLQTAINGEPGHALKSALDVCHQGLFDEVWKRVLNWLPGFEFDTFITCVSEHYESEDKLGRLSMWRAYGGKTGVALVINGAVFDLQTQALAAYASPVSYFDQAQFSDAINEVAANIRSNKEFVSSLLIDELKNVLFNMFRFAVLCTKHPGFAEEKEWRIVASPVLNPSDLLESGIEVVRGVPQPIQKIPLENYLDQDVVGMAVPELIDRVIIGPCEFPDVTAQALCTALRQAGVADPYSLIVESNIPLRHN
jgi:hypothetical protein